MKDVFKRPELNIMTFESTDIITTSGTQAYQDLGEARNAMGNADEVKEVSYKTLGFIF